MTRSEIEGNIKLLKTNGGDDPTYEAQLNGVKVGVIGKGYSRVGGVGWIVYRANEASSLTKKNLADCRRYIADRIIKAEAKNEVAKA
jgi:hypothetical protein